jgi:drug/metabolite transporter (DMT)-like permease
VTSAQKDGTDNVGFAVLAIVFTVLALSLGDALVKQISSDLPLWQIFVLRSVVAVPVLVVMIKTRFSAVSLRPRRLGWTALRSLMLVLMWVIYYAALPNLDLSIAAAAYYTLPLFITLFAALFLGDRVGIVGWAAVVIGFCGVLLIVRPDAEAFNAYALLPLISALLYALAMIITRTKCRGEHPLVLALTLNVLFIVVGALASGWIAMWGPSDATAEAYRFLVSPWLSMGASEWVAIGLLALAIIIGSVGTAIAYQSGPSSIVGTFDFSYLAFAVVWGFLFFGEVPDAITFTGIALIAAAGIVAVRGSARQA